MTITVLVSVTGHVVVVGIHDYLLPLPSPYSLCLQQTPGKVIQIFIPDSVLAHKTFLGTRRGSDKQGSLGQGKENVQISGV